MGLDMYAYAATKPDAELYEVEQREIAYWRKHPNLHGWMERLWEKKLAAQGKEPGESSFGSTFNGVELELTREDIDQLEQDVLEGLLPTTKGFFFGDEADDYYRETDLKFVSNARAELFCGLKVFYNSSW